MKERKEGQRKKKGKKALRKEKVGSKVFILSNSTFGCNKR